MKQTTSLCALVALFICSTAQESNAAITVVAPTSTTSGSFHITTNITFTISTAGGGQAFIFDDWVISDGAQTFPTFSPNLLISVNNSPTISLGGNIADNLDTTASDVTPNDGYLFTSSAFSLAIGDTVTLLAGTYAVSPILGFNPQATQTFTGDMFITNISGVRLSNIVAVAIPEPSITGLLLSWITLIALRRSRK